MDDKKSRKTMSTGNDNIPLTLILKAEQKGTLDIVRYDMKTLMLTLYE